ncbi:hypothetical protein JCM10908_003667 [Rhodotorula pacifica]|uniref:uncharacterized protein n=1 Tax=Rhodotorula pacifica TaxID=1495444 RepID=UPI00317AD68B
MQTSNPSTADSASRTANHPNVNQLDVNDTAAGSSTPIGSPNPAGLFPHQPFPAPTPTPTPSSGATPTTAYALHYPPSASSSGAANRRVLTTAPGPAHPYSRSIPPEESPLLSDHAFRWSASLANWITGATPPPSNPRRQLHQRPPLVSRKTDRQTHNSSIVSKRFHKGWDRFVALWWVKPDPNAPPTPRPRQRSQLLHHRHLHGDTDLPAPGAGGESATAAARLNRKGRIAQVVLIGLVLLGMVELWQLMVGAGRTTGRGGGGGRRRKVDSQKMKLQGRDPFKVLAQLVPSSSSASANRQARPRYSTYIASSSSATSSSSDSTDADFDSLWKEPPLDTGGEIEMYEEASEIGDTTAVVLHWKRTDNVRVILAHLCQYTFFDSVLVWNNNPEVRLTHKDFASSRCPASKLRIYNSPRNLLFLARFLACAQAETPYCYFQDDDWLVRPIRAMYTQFMRDPEGPVVVSTSEEVAVLFGLEWCFYNNPLHICFAWVGTGAFTSRQHVDRFLSLATLLAYPRDELSHADNSFTTFQNEPPYVLTGELVPLPTPFGHSDGEGIQRNKEYIQKGLVRLSSYLDARFPLAELSSSESAARELTPLLSVSPAPYRPSLSPPLPPHPWSHHARSVCVETDSCLFLTNIQLLPPPDASQYPGPEKVPTLQGWEEMLGWVARGWTEGDERWREEESWAVKWGYKNAVDGDPTTAFRSPDLIRRGDYLGLLLLAPLEPSVTRTATLHIILEDAQHVLVDNAEGRIRIEVSADGYRWAPARTDSSGTGPFPTFTCSRSPRFTSSLPFPSLSNSILVSSHARRLIGAERAADQSSTALGRWWTRQRRRRKASPRECTVQVAARMMAASDASSSASAGAGGWKAIRIVILDEEGNSIGGGGGKRKKKAAQHGREDPPAFEVGWGVYEIFVTAEADEAEARRPPPGLWPPGGATAAATIAAQAPPPSNSNGNGSGASTSLLTIVRAQIVFLLSTLSEDNFVRNRDEIRSLIDLHGPAPHAHLIRRLIQGASSLLLTSSPASPQSSSASHQASQPPSPELHLRLLASEVQRCARDPALAERFRDAVLEGSTGEGPNGSDAVLRAMSLPTLLAHPSLNELSPLERLVFCTPFLTLLYPAAATQGLKRALGLDAARLVRQALPGALEQLGAPAKSPRDLAELSPLPISRLLAILLSDLYLGEAPPPSATSATSSNPERAFSDEERRAIVLAAVRGRLGPEVGAQALAHAFNEVAFDEQRPPTPITALVRLAPVPALSSPELVRSILSKFGGLQQADDAHTGGGGGGVEMRVAQQMFELIEYASREGETGRGGGIDVASWVRAVHELQPSLRWGDVIRGYDSPLRAASLPDHHFGLRAFAAILQHSPSPPPTAEDPHANPVAGLVSHQGGTSAISGLWSPWANPALQFSLIDRLVFLASSPPAGPPGVVSSSFSSSSDGSSFNLSNLASVHKVVSLDDAAQSGPSIKALAQAVQNSPWNALELIKTLVNLGGDGSNGGGANGEVAARVHELLDRGCKMNPELVLIALTQVEKPWNAIHSELVARLLSTFLTGHPAHQLVFLRLYQIDRQFLFAALRDFYAESEMNVTRIVDIAQDLKALDQVLELRPFVLALDLAALASRREYLNLEKWLTSQFQTHGSQLVRTALEFVGHKVQHELRRQEVDNPPEPTTLALNAATIAVFMRVLRAHHVLFTGGDVELFKEVRTQCLQLHPRLMNFSPKNTDSEPGMAVTAFSPEIEAECDALYKRMYEQEISVDKVVTALRQAKESDNQHDHEFFACFLHGLFDEHRFFNTYPANELSLTASLFGDLIQYHLIDFVPLGIAVRYVLDALRNPPDSNWFRFGIQALARFQSRLSEWPQLAHSILSIPHVQQLHPDVANIARQALIQREENGGGGSAPGGVDIGSMAGDALESEQPLEPERHAFTAIRVDEDGGDPDAPDEQTSDKILFIVNNLAPTNFENKVQDMLDRIEPVHFAWFAHYLVAQRVSIEPNNHQLYQQFLEALKMPALVKRVLYETFVKLATLLNSDKTVQSSTERTLLKNLGSWLGGLTLAKDKPIKHSNIAFKQLLIEGYDSNRLIVAIPFVCKVLEQCSKSRVFRPPNPWLMAILRLLVELYQFAELKLNLKFEIEVLCKSLDIDLKEIEPTDILRNRTEEIAAREAQAAGQAQAQAAALAAVAAGGAQPGMSSSSVELALANLAAQHQQQQQHGGHDLEEHALRAGFGNAPSGAAHHALPAAGSQGDTGRIPPMLGSNQAGYSLSLQDTVSAALQNLPALVVFNSQLPVFSTNPALKRAVCLAIDRAIREIIAPVVERSVTIAGISTRELTMKDFAMEGDEGKMATAAHLMVQSLAGSLALVTCKEPLRLSMVAHVRTLLLQNGFTDENLPEQAVLVVVAENLDLACGVVEKVAMDKAILEVDEGLAPAYLSRRSHRERSREAFWDTAAMAASHYSGMLPDPLRLKLGGLSPPQLQVYEDFSRLRTAIPPVVDGRNGAMYADSPAMAPAVTAPQIAAAAAIAADTVLLSGPQVMEKFASLIAELDKALAAEAPASALTGVAQDSELRRLLQQIPLVAASSLAIDETALACSQKVVQLLYRSETTLARDTYVFLLDRLCAISTKVAKEVTMWLVYAEDERKFNVPVTVALLQSRFINVAELDLQLAKSVVRDFRASVVDFVAGLLAACLAEVPPVATREQFANSFEALNQAVRQGKATDAARTLLQDIQKASTASVRDLSPGDKLPPAEEPAVREQLTACFGEWVRLYQQSFNVEKSFVEFVVQLQKQGILKGEEISSLFFRVCAEVSIDSYIKNKAAGGTPATGIFQPIDAFARLITFMIKYHADPTGVNNDKAKVVYLTKTLSIVVLVIANSHETLGVHFQAKPGFRFFSSLLSNLAAVETHLGQAYQPILVALSHSLTTLSPSLFPGFSYSFLALTSHPRLMPKLLNGESREGEVAFTRLITSNLRFLAPSLRQGRLRDGARALYLGTQRLLLVLLHDYPSYLSRAAYALLDAIPSNCVQMINIVTSSFPVEQSHLPDPLSPGLSLESLAESQRVPQILVDYTAALSAAGMKPILDQYLAAGEPAQVPAHLLSRLERSGSATDIKGAPTVNVQLINSLVLHLASVALNQHKAQKGQVGFDAESSPFKLLRQLVYEAGHELRYHLVVALVNHLRFPSAHTTWSHRALLALFAGANEECQEGILRVVLERTIASRPTPWGLLATFGALLQTQQAAIAAILAKLPDERGSAEFTAVIGDLAARASATPAVANNALPAANTA